MSTEVAKGDSMKNKILIVRIIVLVVYTIVVFWLGRFTANDTSSSPVQSVPKQAVSQPDTISQHVELVSWKVEKAGKDTLQFALEFQCLEPFSKEYRIYTHAYPDDKSLLPDERKASGFLNFDHDPDIKLTSLIKGKPWHHRFLVPSKYLTGKYTFELGFFFVGSEKLRDEVRFIFDPKSLGSR